MPVKSEVTVQDIRMAGTALRENIERAMADYRRRIGMYPGVVIGHLQHSTGGKVDEEIITMVVTSPSIDQH